MNDYYLIALDEIPKVIKIKANYLDGIMNDSFVECSKIEYIDYVMSKYNLLDIKKKLSNTGKISNINTKILVFHRHKFKGKNHLKSFEVITKDDLTDEFKSAIEHQFKDGSIKVKDVEKTIKTFFNKYRNKDFKEMVDWIYTDLNEHKLKEIHIIYNQLFDKEKKDTVLNKNVDYKVIRKLFCLINLSNKFDKCSDYINYLSDINVYKKKHIEKLLDITDPNNINGQMTFDEMNDKKEDGYLSDYINLKNEILNSSWDDEYIKECVEKNIIPYNFNEIMTLEDKVRAGLIDIVDYIHLKEENKSKGLK